MAPGCSTTAAGSRRMRQVYAWARRGPNTRWRSRQTPAPAATWVVITQSDVNEIQLAKGAIQAGLEILLESTGTPAEAVDEMIVAGAFGSLPLAHS